MAICATLTLGCTSAQLDQLNTTAVQAQTGAAVRLVSSATIAQMALIHMAAALSQAASLDFDDGDVPPLTGAPQPGADFTYELDNQLGTGKVVRTHVGKRTVDLAFAFVSERGNSGMAYTITRTSGTFEGYQLFFTRLTLLYSSILGDNILPLKHENGRFLFNIDIKGIGSLGVNGAETVRLTKADFNLTYPISEGEGRVGVLKAVDNNGTMFDGNVVMANKALTLQGAIKAPNGTLAYEFKTGPGGDVSLVRPASAPQPPAPAND